MWVTWIEETDPHENSSLFRWFRASPNLNTNVVHSSLPSRQEIRQYYESISRKTQMAHEGVFEYTATVPLLLSMLPSVDSPYGTKGGEDEGGVAQKE
ncbi:hypothetical protein BgiMline_017724 [Biomphalaria glabrata]|nr:hypothetical protein BgiMline_005359 [Biomphalaria glabrata]